MADQIPAQRERRFVPVDTLLACLDPMLPLTWTALPQSVQDALTRFQTRHYFEGYAVGRENAGETPDA